MNISIELIKKYNSKIINISQYPEDNLYGDFYYDLTDRQLKIGYKPKDSFTLRDLEACLREIEVNFAYNPLIWPNGDDNND